MAPDVPIMTMGVATPGGGALVAYFETVRSAPLRRRLSRLSHASTTACPQGDGATKLLRLDGKGKLVGDVVNAGNAILPPTVNNPLVTKAGGIIMWLGGTNTIVRLE